MIWHPFKGWRETANQNDVSKLERAVAEAGVNSGDLLADAHAFVAKTPCAIMLVQADDLSEETEPLNVPGTDKERANWRRRLSVTVDELPGTRHIQTRDGGYSENEARQEQPALGRFPHGSGAGDGTLGALAGNDHAQHFVMVDVRYSRRPDNLSVFHHAKPVGEIENVMQVMADQEDADAFGLELLDEFAHLRRFLRAKRCRGFVHDQDAGVEMDRTCNGN